MIYNLILYEWMYFCYASPKHSLSPVSCNPHQGQSAQPVSTFLWDLTGSRHCLMHPFVTFILKYQADSWQQFFKSNKGYPKFLSKIYRDDSVTFPEGSFKLNGTSLHLQRIGQVVLSGSNPYEGCNTKQVVIKREEDKFYATVCYEVSAINTSRRCYACGHIDADNRRSQAVFRCVVCDHLDNADVNAALNIKALGTRAIGRGRGVCVSNLDDPSGEYGMVVNHSV